MDGERQLDLRAAVSVEELPRPAGGRCALEDDDFPFAAISDVAESESWRKEINRPIYHIHKWWARRLGTVFRAIVLGALAPSGTNILEAFYQPVRVTGRVVFDPFMGSGTTIGEALKLGARAIGRDINPVAHFLVRNALAQHDLHEVERTFSEIERDVAEEIKAFYRTELADGTSADVLYFFWVKQMDCPQCDSEVDLFSSRVFARHAYPSRHPTVHSVCPNCGEVNACRYDAVETACKHCLKPFELQSGPVCGSRAVCPACNHEFPIAKTIRGGDAPPAHRLYAKLVLTAAGEKLYGKVTEADKALYAKASKSLSERPDAYPRVAIESGYNTDQVMGYNYRYWHQMFNDRQLLCLAILGERIRAISNKPLRELFTCLFSGMLEFNNMFASYKGEGTGAVRHMFAHHILKPERVPLEANVWGTSKSSGSFKTMFEGRIRRALQYAQDPFELRCLDGARRQRTEKVFRLSESLGFEIAEDAYSFDEGKRVYLSCGDSSGTDLPAGSVDAVITDPPFFDNVHYSQLADFFHVWQRHILADRSAKSTRSEGDVQHADAMVFAKRLTSVWAEAHRVLADNGVLVFTYHHSRNEGWRSVLDALMSAGFRITAAHPVKAEMSVAMPKLQAKEPIDLDVILVCRKRGKVITEHSEDCRWSTIQAKAAGQVQQFQNRNRKLSRNDVRVIVMAQVIMELSHLNARDKALDLLDTRAEDVEVVITKLLGSGRKSGEERG